mmetsp:Transcript_1016/g.2154  ORF Transcript_1016/g.2154 Transcript_1016/m.2154 type:complete len:231 (-) Transcript_1016:1012-1704(-)
MEPETLPPRARNARSNTDLPRVSASSNAYSWSATMSASVDVGSAEAGGAGSKVRRSISKRSCSSRAVCSLRAAAALSSAPTLSIAMLARNTSEMSFFRLLTSPCQISRSWTWFATSSNPSYIPSSYLVTFTSSCCSSFPGPKMDRSASSWLSFRCRPVIRPHLGSACISPIMRSALSSCGGRSSAAARSMASSVTTTWFACRCGSSNFSWSRDVARGTRRSRAWSRRASR